MMPKGMCRVFLYILLVISPVIVVTFFNPGALHQKGILYEIAKSMALVAFMILMLQPVLAGRFKWIEAPYGMDILIRFHRHMGIFAVALLVLHPVLLAAGGAGWKLLYSLNLPWYIWVGKIALVILLINGGLSLFQTPLKIKFEKWRFWHDVLGPTTLALAFVHSWYTGRNLENPLLKWIWSAMLIIAAGVFVYHRFLRPRKLSRYPYRVLEVKPEIEDVWSVTLAPPRGTKKVFDYVPGQFHFITFHRDRGLPEEEHHWTISSSPTEQGFLTSTIKALGDFTATIGETRPGDTATVHGPFGRFSYIFHPEERDLVFIAGGIGVTPLRSMLRHMKDTEKDRSVLFIYANPDEKSIVFRRELEKIAEGDFPRLKLVHVLENPGPNWTGEQGMVDREKIERLCKNKLKTAGFYVCGPPGLLEAVIGHLKDLGVPDKRIHLEIFSFLD